MRTYRHTTTAATTSVTLAVIFVTVAIGIATAQAYFEDKRNEMQNQMPFFMGTRYGRSRPPANVVVAPRNDKFFMGSRYGKRSSRTAGVPASTVTCRYTGVGTFYRCEPDTVLREGTTLMDVVVVGSIDKRKAWIRYESCNQKDQHEIPMQGVMVQEGQIRNSENNWK